jgi:proteasome lid subunit RPN8/RPN11
VILDPAIVAILTDRLEDARGETCGVLMRGPDGQRWVSLPTAGTGEHRFVIAREAWRRVVRLAGEPSAIIEAFVHSYARTLELSSADRVALDAGDVRWLVVRLGVVGLGWAAYEPSAAPKRATSPTRPATPSLR